MKNNLSNIKYLIQTIWQEDKVLFIILFFDTLIASVISLPNIILPKYILDEIIYGQQFDKALILVAVMVGLNGLMSIVADWLEKQQKKKSKRLEFKLHTNVTRKTMDMDYEKLLHPDTYDQMYLASDIANGDNFMRLIQNVKGFFSNIILLLSMLYLIIQVDLIIMALTILVVVINSITSAFLQKKLFKTRKETSSLIRRLEYIARLAWHIDYAKEVRIYKLKDFIFNKYNTYNEFVLQRIFHNYGYENRGRFINTLFGSLQTFALYVVLGFKVFLKQITVGDFTLYMNAINTFKNALSGLLGNIISIQDHSRYFEGYINYMNAEQKAPELSKWRDPGENLTFTFEDVYFQYPGKDSYALENVNIAIQNNQSISLVGENGAGKTTFILLLLRLLKPTKGRILCNGIDIQSIPFDVYINYFAAVFQDYRIFSFSINENVSFENMEEQAVRKAIEDSGLGSVIDNLPNKAGSIIGQDFDDKGINLSGGESQKLAIARAIYKEAPVIILDEPTSSLDARSEYEIFQRMKVIASRKTTIFISHRLYSTIFCDKIIVFDHGRIIETGNHSELVKANGKYAEMFGIQTQYYAEEDKE